MLRVFRCRANFGTKIKNYPYDVQYPEFKISSYINPEEFVQIVTTRWNSLNGLPTNTTKTEFNNTKLATIQHER